MTCGPTCPDLPQRMVLPVSRRSSTRPGSNANGGRALAVSRTRATPVGASFCRVIEVRRRVAANVRTCEPANQASLPRCPRVRTVDVGTYVLMKETAGPGGGGRERQRSVAAALHGPRIRRSKRPDIPRKGTGVANCLQLEPTEKDVVCLRCRFARFRKDWRRKAVVRRGRCMVPWKKPKRGSLSLDLQ